MVQKAITNYIHGSVYGVESYHKLQPNMMQVSQITPPACDGKYSSSLGKANFTNWVLFYFIV